MIKLERKTKSGRIGWIQVIYSSLEDIKVGFMMFIFIWDFIRWRFM